MSDMVDLDLDLVTSAHQKMVAFAPFHELVLEGLIGTEAPTTATDAEKIAGAWLFQGLDDEGRPFRDPEGTGTCVVVLSERERWANNAHNTARFPTLQMLVYADSTREVDGSPLTRDAERKVKHVSKRLDRCFHEFDTLNSDHAWPGNWVFYSRRSKDLDIREVPGTMALTVRGELLYQCSTD